MTTKIPKTFPKQTEFLSAVFSGKYKYLMYGGAVAGGKSYLMAILFVGLAIDYPGSRYAIIRRNLTTLKRTTIKTFEKFLNNYDIPYNLNKADYTLTLEQSNSTIEFIEADETKDPDFNKLKGLEVSAVGIDEANEVSEEAFNILITRKGRWNDSGVPEFIMLTCNPAQNWVKSKFFDKWESDKLEPPYYYLPAKPTDNPHNSDAYLQSLEDLPPKEYKRYVEGDWAFAHNPSQIVYYEWLKNNVCEPMQKADRIGVDCAYTGDDTTVLAYVYKSNLCYLNTLDVDITNTSLQALKIKNIANDLDVPARMVNVDATGIGAGIYDTLELQGFKAQKFIAAGKALEKYKAIDVDGKTMEVKSTIQFGNKRAEAYWTFRESLRNNEIKVIYDKELWEELTNTEYLERNGKIYIEPKEKIKKKIGRSPDKADAVVIAYAKIKTKRRLAIV